MVLGEKNILIETEMVLYRIDLNKVWRSPFRLLHTSSGVLMMGCEIFRNTFCSRFHCFFTFVPVCRTHLAMFFGKLKSMKYA
jgi:hypothetical protein